MELDALIHRLTPVGGPIVPEKRPLTPEEAIQRFRAALEHSGVTNEYAAMRAGIHPSRISEYINSKVPGWPKLMYLIQSIPLDPRFFFPELMGAPPTAKKHGPFVDIKPRSPKRYRSKKSTSKEVDLGPKFDVQLHPHYPSTVVVCSYLPLADVEREICEKTPDVHWTNNFPAVYCGEYPTNRHYYFSFSES